MAVLASRPARVRGAVGRGGRTSDWAAPAWLRPCRERPCCGAAEKRDEVAPRHSTKQRDEIPSSHFSLRVRPGCHGNLPPHAPALVKECPEGRRLPPAGPSPPKHAHAAIVQ